MNLIIVSLRNWLNDLLSLNHRKKFNSFVFKQGGFTLNGNCLTINKGEKRFRFSYSRVYEGNVKQIRIVRETCYRYSLIIITDHNLINSYRKTHDGASIGLDFGLKTYLTKSDGSKIDSPLFFKQYQNKIRKLNKRLSNAKKGSNNRRRRLFELQQTYRKINDLRSDFQWGLAHQLCKQYDYIFIEDPNIEGMKRLWGKKVSDLSHSSFIDKLTYVASKYGVIVHKIDNGILLPKLANVAALIKDCRYATARGYARRAER